MIEPEPEDLERERETSRAAATLAAFIAGLLVALLLSALLATILLLSACGGPWMEAPFPWPSAEDCHLIDAGPYAGTWGGACQGSGNPGRNNEHDIIQPVLE